MRMSKLFSQTLRDIPAEADSLSHQLLLRSGYIRQLGAGIFSYLPLAQRALIKIQNIMRQEINSIGGQEIEMPVVHPAELWRQSGRWHKIGSELGRFKDKNNHDLVLSMTHEEVIADLARKEIKSYRQLPQLLYHIQTKWRDDPRPRAGLIRAREFTMLDSYSLDRDWDGLDIQYQAHHSAYERIFKRCGIPVISVKSDTGIMGGKIAHEFMYLTSIGEDSIVQCEQCGYTANKQVARSNKAALHDGELLPIEKVATPNSKTIDELANFLSIPPSRTAKAVFLVATFLEGENKYEKFIFTMVRGDMDVNETKLANLLNAIDLRPATDDEIRSVGAVPGYASPIGLRNTLVVVDEIIPKSTNLVAGANIEGYHLRNLNYERDFSADMVGDISLAVEGDRCIQCGTPVHIVRGVEVGNIFKLGTHFSESMGCYYLDNQGKLQPIVMGSYGIGVGRLLACIVEEHHDEKGIIWPMSVAPFQVHMTWLPWNESGTFPEYVPLAEKIYTEFNESEIECLFDDREESPGVKFNDADLIGIPIRITVSQRALKNGGVELKQRNSPEKTIVPLDNILSTVKDLIKRLEQDL